MNPWLDEQQILVGESIHGSVNSALCDARFVIMLVSRHSLSSRWVELQVNAVQARERVSGRVILLPVEIEAVGEEMIPPLLADRRRARLHPSYADGLADIERTVAHLASR